MIVSSIDLDNLLTSPSIIAEGLGASVKQDGTIIDETTMLTEYIDNSPSVDSASEARKSKRQTKKKDLHD
jgi:hypothetical protein